MASSSSFDTHTVGQEGAGEGNDGWTNISGTTIVGILRGGTCVVGADGRITKTLFTESEQGRNVTHKSPSEDEWIKFHYLTHKVFVAYAGEVQPALQVVGRVKHHLKVIPHKSIEDIARTFVYWANIHNNTLYGPNEGVEFILFGHMRNEDVPQMIKIFPFGDHPSFEAANASNPASVKLCSGVPEGPYVAHAYAMCVIGSEIDSAWDSLQKATHIDDNNEEQMREVALMAVASGSSTAGLSGGTIRMVTLSKNGAPRFHAADPVKEFSNARGRHESLGRSDYGPIKKDKNWVPRGYKR